MTQRNENIVFKGTTPKTPKCCAALLAVSKSSIRCKLLSATLENPQRAPSFFKKNQGAVKDSFAQLHIQRFFV